MLYFLVYDISDDKTRSHVSEFLKNFGCTRIQYSAFVGDLSEAELNEILRFSERVLGEGRGVVMAIPVCKMDVRRLIEIPRRASNEEGGYVF